MKTDLMPFWVWDEQLDIALDKIANGSSSDGYVVLSHFVHKVETGQVPDPRSLKFIVEAFKKILMARDAGKEIEYENIFGMPMAHSRPPLTMKGSYDRALKYGSEVSKLMESGDTNLKAIEQVAKKYNRSEKNIQEYYTLFNRIAAGKTIKTKEGKTNKITKN